MGYTTINETKSTCRCNICEKSKDKVAIYDLRFFADEHNCMVVRLCMLCMKRLGKDCLAIK